MAYYAVRVTLAQANTNYKLVDLVRALRPGSAVPDMARQLSMQADAGNTQPVLVGDENLSATDYGLSLSSGSPPFSYITEGANVPLGGIWVRSAAANQSLLVSILEA